MKIVGMSKGVKPGLPAPSRSPGVSRATRVDCTLEARELEDAAHLRLHAGVAVAGRGTARVVLVLEELRKSKRQRVWARGHGSPSAVKGRGEAGRPGGVGELLVGHGVEDYPGVGSAVDGRHAPSDYAPHAATTLPAVSRQPRTSAGITTGAGPAGGRDLGQGVDCRVLVGLGLGADDLDEVGAEVAEGVIKTMVGVERCPRARFSTLPARPRDGLRLPSWRHGYVRRLGRRFERTGRHAGVRRRRLDQPAPARCGSRVDEQTSESAVARDGLTFPPPDTFKTPSNLSCPTSARDASSMLLGMVSRDRRGLALDRPAHPAIL